MVRKLIEWAVNSSLIVVLLALLLAGVGSYAFFSVNVEAYPDPAPAIIEVLAQYPGASAEEVERLVTIPLEVALAGMPNLHLTRSKSLAGLSHLRNQFDYGVDYYAARQEVINRLALVNNLPTGVNPQISPFTPTGELIRYTITSPRDRTRLEVTAEYPSASPQQVERSVTVPLRTALASLKGARLRRTESGPGVCRIHLEVKRGTSHDGAGKEAAARLAKVTDLPQGVRPRVLPPRTVYTLNDLKALQDWTLEREFRRVPRIAGVTGFGGTVKRYEAQPDPDRLRRYGITLTQFTNAISNSNQNVGAGYLTQGPVTANVRGVGLFGRGLDPMVDAMRRPYALSAAAHLREEERQRVDEVLNVVVNSTNNVPVHVRDLVDHPEVIAHDWVDGKARRVDAPPRSGVAVGNMPRFGRVGVSRPLRNAEGKPVVDDQGNVVWDDNDDAVQAIILMRKNEHTLPSLDKVKEKMKELNETKGQMLPGTKMEPHFDLTGLINVTTETVHENLILGMVLVAMILFMFLGNVRSALIVAINVPLALLFAFSILFLRGKSANLLSIGAVDFGIIVDSSVIMVENIYRHVSSGENADLPLKDRVIIACHEVEKPLFFSTLIMVCAFIPLFTMRGPEGQIFGPMADTYAFALGGALVLALTLAPVLCVFFFRNLKPARDNFLVRYLKASYLRQLERCLNHRYLTLAFFGTLTVVTMAATTFLGREFMPELEEGNLYIRGTFPVNVSLDEASDKATAARAIMRQFPEVAVIQSQVGRPDDGTDPCGFYNVEFSIPLRPDSEWPKVVSVTTWWRRLYQGSSRARTKPELIKAMNEALANGIPGVDWNFSQYIRDNVMESLSGVKGDNSVKIIGPDLDELERLAELFKARLEAIHGVENVGVFRILGQPNLNLTIDREACKHLNVSVKDVQTAIQVAVGGQACSTMIEGEKTFDITLRWPERLRGNEQSILDLPIEVTNNTTTPGGAPSIPSTPVGGSATGVSPMGSNIQMPSWVGSPFGATFNYLASVPRVPLRQLVVKVNAKGQVPRAALREAEAAGKTVQELRQEHGISVAAADEARVTTTMRVTGLDSRWSFLRKGASTIYREQGKRLIAIKFSVNNEKRDLAGAVAEAQSATAELVPVGYKTEWSGEFQQMKAAERRLMYIIPIALGLIFVLLYVSFRNLLDTLVVLSNVIDLSIGGIWMLLLTGTHFSISAAVGFVSIFGIAIMDGLLLISYFNQMRAQGLPLREAIIHGAEKRVRPVMMTALTAIFGLLPAAVSTRIGSQTQRPLALVVVGGMVTTLFLTRYLMPVLYSFYGHREPPAGSGGMAH